MHVEEQATTALHSISKKTRCRKKETIGRRQRNIERMLATIPRRWDDRETRSPGRLEKCLRAPAPRRVAIAARRRPGQRAPDLRARDSGMARSIPRPRQRESPPRWQCVVLVELLP